MECLYSLEDYDGLAALVKDREQQLLSSLELSDTKSMSLKYEPASEPLHISVKWLFSPAIMKCIPRWSASTAWRTTTGSQR